MKWAPAEVVMPRVLRTAAFRLMIWSTARLAAEALTPAPLYRVRGHFEALLHTGPATIALSAVAIAAVFLTVRSAWLEFCGHWCRQ
jgi:hypothetical protein